MQLIPLNPLKKKGPGRYKTGRGSITTQLTGASGAEGVVTQNALSKIDPITF